MLGVNELAAQTIVFTVACIKFMVPLGIQEATSSITGNCIGANNAPLAKRFYSMIIKIAFVVILMICSATAIFRNQIARCFVTDEVVAAMAAKCILLNSLNLVFDCTQGVLQGPIRGLGL